MQNNEVSTKAIAISAAIVFFVFIFGRQLFPKEIVDQLEDISPIQKFTSSELVDDSLFANQNASPKVISRFGGLVQYVDVKKGFGGTIKEGSLVRVKFEGFLEREGVLFTRTNPGETIEFVIGKEQVIPGIEIALLGARAGGIRGIRLDPRVAYGENGIGPIPPNSVVLFRIEIVEVLNNK